MKSWLKLSSLVATLALLAACSSGLQQDMPLNSEEGSLTTQATVVTSSVPDSASDAEEDNDGRVGLSSTILELGYKNPSTSQKQTVGLRFANINVPKGATVTDARIEFTAPLDRTETTSLKIYGNNVANAKAFLAGSNDITSRAKTKAFVDWEPGTWTAERKYASPNLASIVGEISSRPDWVKGAAMAFVISGTGYRKAYAYEAPGAHQPVLRVYYESPTTNPPPTDPPPPTNPPPSTDTNPNCYTTGTYATTINEPLRTLTTRHKYGNLKNSTLTKNSARVDASKLIVKRNHTRNTKGDIALEVSDNTGTGRLCIRGGTYNPNIQVDASWEPDFHSDPSIYLYNSPNTTIENVAIIRGGDAFTLKEGNNNTTIRDSYIYRAGDDVVENDRKSANLVVDDILADSAYTGFSCQHEVPFNGTRVEWTIKNSLIGLRREKGAVDGQKPIKLWKWNKGSYDKQGRTNCRVTFQDNVILVARPSGDLVIDPATYGIIKKPGDGEYVSDSPIHYEACRGHQNTIVYTGPTNTSTGAKYYKQLQAEVGRHPECFKLTTDYNVWKNARTAWFNRHLDFKAKYGDEAGKFINSEN